MMPKPKIPPSARHHRLEWGHVRFAGSRSASDSDSEGEPALPVLTSGQVVVAAAQPQVLLPWEQGVFRDIFQGRPILECSLPTPQVILPVDETTTLQEPQVGQRSNLDQGTSANLPRRDHSADVFSKVIRHNKADLSFQENETAMWARAISKWQTLFEASPSASFTRQLENMDQEAKMTSLRDMFGSKSPHTVEKRLLPSCASSSGCKQKPTLTSRPGRNLCLHQRPLSTGFADTFLPGAKESWLLRVCSGPYFRAFCVGRASSAELPLTQSSRAG